MLSLDVYLSSLNNYSLCPRHCAECFIDISYLILNNPKCRCYYSPFIDKESEANRGQVTQGTHKLNRRALPRLQVFLGPEPCSSNPTHHLLIREGFPGSFGKSLWPSLGAHCTSFCYSIDRFCYFPFNTVLSGFCVKIPPQVLRKPLRKNQHPCPHGLSGGRDSVGYYGVNK